MSNLPPPFADWFAARGWTPHAYQLDLIARAAPGAADLLIAPTGGGKTLAGFLPSLIDLAGNAEAGPATGLHTLYVSPLRALAADIRRNLEAPVAEMGLPIRIEDRTGDTKQAARRRQRADPPHILLTTPESLALLLSYEDASRIFGGLKAVIVDETHAMAGGKRGDQLALGLARLRTLAPDHRRIGLSATTEDPAALANWLEPGACRVLVAPPGPKADITILETAGDPPWSGDGGRYAARAVMAEIEKAGTTLVFINTRALAELFFQALWAVNDGDLPIGLHHGSLSREARERVEGAMATGQLRAVVCTSSLDLGIDWGAVDLVIQVGAPKGVKRLVQRIGRANHRFDTPSRAILVPGNRLEVIECRCALAAVEAGELDGEPAPPGRLDVLCQHILLTACAGPFDADALFAEVCAAGPYQAMTREEFDRCLDFCATGGYALRSYDRWRRLMETEQGWRLRDPRASQRLRMNIGTIVESEKLKVRSGGGRSRMGGRRLGEVEETFAAQLRPGDTFLIGGEVVKYDAIQEMTVRVSPAPGRDPLIPAFNGGRLAVSTFLAHRIIEMLNDQTSWADLPGSVEKWLRHQQRVSSLPRKDELMVETYRRRNRWHMIAYGFAGRNAHHTMGLIVTKRMEAAGLDPLGYVCSDYGLMVWGLEEVTDPAPLFSAEGFRDGLDRWLFDSMMMKKSFRQAATVAGLIERRLPGMQKTGRQATFSSDILYDTLIKYDPEHLIMEATRREAMSGMVDFDRIEEMLTRIDGRVRVVKADSVTPLSAPLLVEVNKQAVRGAAEERLLGEEADALMAELSREG